MLFLCQAGYNPGLVQHPGVARRKVLVRVTFQGYVAPISKQLIYVFVALAA